MLCGRGCPVAPPVVRSSLFHLAIVFKEAVEQFVGFRGNFALQIFATDSGPGRDRPSARQSLFQANIAADVSPERLRRFFVKEERGYQVRKEIREMVIFAPQNLIMDPPFTKLDILSCRNLLIYLTSGGAEEIDAPVSLQSQSRLGILLLGRSAGNQLAATPSFLPRSRANRESFDARNPTCGPSQSSFPHPLARACPPGRRQVRLPNLRPVSSLRRNSWSCSVTLRQPCSPMTRVTSFISVAGPANTWSRPPARQTGTFLP